MSVGSCLFSTWLVTFAGDSKEGEGCVNTSLRPEPQGQGRGAQPRALLPPWDGPARPPCFAAGRVSEWAALARRLASLWMAGPFRELDCQVSDGLYESASAWKAMPVQFLPELPLKGAFRGLRVVHLTFTVLPVLPL